MLVTNTTHRVLLPCDVVPEQYDLTLEPDLERFTFDGSVNITVDVQVATDTVALHAKELLISVAKFTPSEGGAVMEATEIALKIQETTCTLTFKDVLRVGKGILTLTFRGTLSDQMAGFYRSKYTDSKGKQASMAVTQFQAIDARRCFPCWDEPARKAIFLVTLVYPAKLMAISNMPPSKSEILPDGRRRETFMPTPKMSSYLLAFCVGELEFVSGVTQAGTVARIFCCPGNVARCSYALQCCIRALDFYNEFFGIPYPLPKVDMIAIPDFALGAMENWGLVTYREVTLLCNEATVSATQKKRICTVITHELAHQWFGNLVTMGWWDDLWLNEGFAKWMENFAADHFYPEWHIWETFVMAEQQSALELDALRSSHPIQVPIKHAKEVEEVFDAISYCKGGSIVRMIYAVLGEAKFQEGLQLYFKRHRYGNTETTDLWAAWSEVSGTPVDRMMGPWMTQMGYPVLKVLSDPVESGSDEVEVEQQWFLADGSVQPDDDKKVWVTPVLIAGDKKGLAPAVFMEAKKAKLSCGGCAAGASWLKLNFGQHVPVRVLYPPTMLARLAAGAPALPAEDRIGLLSDSYALCKSGAQDPSALLQVLQGFSNESNDKVWGELGAVLGGLNRIMLQGLSPETSTAFANFAAKLVLPAFSKVGWDVLPTDDDNMKQLRNTLLELLGCFCYKDPVVVGEAMKRFRQFVDAPKDAGSLAADIRLAVLSIAVQSEDAESVVEQLLTSHGSVEDGAARNHMYMALGAVPSVPLKKKVLAFALSDDVRAQDLVILPTRMAVSGKEGAECVFDCVKDSYDTIYGKLGRTSMFLFNRVIQMSGSGFADEGKAKEVEDFWRSKGTTKAVDKTVSQTVEGIRSNAKFLERLRSSSIGEGDAWVVAANKM